MIKWGMFFRQFDPTLLFRTVGGTARKADGSGTWPFFMGTDGPGRAGAVSVLKAHGIDSWGWGSTAGNDWMFVVRRGQAQFAEDLLLKAGAPLKGRRVGGGGYRPARPERGRQ